MTRSHMHHTRCWIAPAAMLAAAGSALGTNTLLAPSQFATISSAVSAAQEGDTILVSPGVYREVVWLEGRNITIRSTDGPGVTFISGDLDGDEVADVGPVFLTEAGETASTVLEGFTLTHSTDNGNGYGGAVVITNSSPTIRRCVITNSVAEGAAGGATIDQSSSLFEDVDFIGNTSPGGAGAFTVSVLTDVTFRRCTFIGNSAEGGYGGINVASRGRARFESCLIAGNFAEGGQGAGAIESQARADFVNCVFTGNGSDGGSGGLTFIGGSSGSLINCTFSENRDAGGASLALTASTNSAVLVANSIVWSSGAGAQVAGAGLTVRNSTIKNGFASGVSILISDPQFLDPLGPDGVAGTADDDLRLDPGSPSVDAGDASDLPAGVTTDAAGLARVVGAVDHGAYEAQGSGCAADFNNDGFVDFFDLDAYIECFEGGACPSGRDADFNSDGFIDFFDLDAFVEAFETGC
ncbi:MAG: right-handed parallel beta-helix repeat-containing protein [Phycisphaeraceae bacterium]|nr:MAG: right-handed parallel beta-helix repeat-containing protein [Phycisphaeraceae bacterium]